LSEDELDLQGFEATADERGRLLGLAQLGRDPRGVATGIAEMAGPIGVEGQRSAVVLEIVEEELAVRRPGLAHDEAGHEQAIGGVVDRFDQPETARVAVLEPGVVGGVELDQLPQGSSTGTGLAMAHSSRADFPLARLDQPAAQRVRVDRSDLGIAGEMLGQKRRPEAAIDGPCRPLQDPGLEAGWLGVIGSTATVPMDHGCIALHLEAPAQASKLATRQPEPLRTAPGRNQARVDLPEHRNTITIAKAQTQHLLPRSCQSTSAEANKLRKRTLLNQQGRTFLLQYYTRS
jgi:hypothetical protein